MTISDKKANELIRESMLSDLIDYLHEHGIEEVLKVKSNEIAIPTVDCNEDEKWMVITVKVPTGADKGREPYDGYAEAENYEHELAEKKLKAEKKAKEKAEKIRKDKEIREKKKEVSEKG